MTRARYDTRRADTARLTSGDGPSTGLGITKEKEA